MVRRQKIKNSNVIKSDLFKIKLNIHLNMFDKLVLYMNMRHKQHKSLYFRTSQHYSLQFKNQKQLIYTVMNCSILSRSLNLICFQFQFPTPPLIHANLSRLTLCFLSLNSVSLPHAHTSSFSYHPFFMIFPRFWLYLEKMASCNYTCHIYTYKY